MLSMQTLTWLHSAALHKEPLRSNCTQCNYHSTNMFTSKEIQHYAALPLTLHEPAEAFKVGLLPLIKIGWLLQLPATSQRLQAHTQRHTQKHRHTNSDTNAVRTFHHSLNRAHPGCNIRPILLLLLAADPLTSLGCTSRVNTVNTSAPLSPWAAYLDCPAPHLACSSDFLFAKYCNPGRISTLNTLCMQTHCTQVAHKCMQP
jgi:hypothetical protein